MDVANVKLMFSILAITYMDGDPLHPEGDFILVQHVVTLVSKGVIKLILRHR